MLFTWDTTNLCIVFKQWHIRSTPGLIVSLVAVVLIAMGYEGLRATCRLYEQSIEARVETAPSESCPCPKPLSSLACRFSFAILQRVRVFRLIVCVPNYCPCQSKRSRLYENHVLCQVCTVKKRA